MQLHSSLLYILNSQTDWKRLVSSGLTSSQLQVSIPSLLFLLYVCVMIQLSSFGDHSYLSKSQFLFRLGMWVGKPNLGNNVAQKQAYVIISYWSSNNETKLVVTQDHILNLEICILRNFQVWKMLEKQQKASSIHFTKEGRETIAALHNINHFLLIFTSSVEIYLSYWGRLWHVLMKICGG